jgi:hypothetical protein
MPPRVSRARSYLGRVLEGYRYDKGYSSHKQLYDHFKEQGYNISLSSINKYELGERLPTEEHLSAFVVLLGLDADDERALLHCRNAEVRISYEKEYRRCKEEHEQRMRKEH